MLLINLARAFWLLLSVGLMAALKGIDPYLWLTIFVIVLAAGLTMGDLSERKLLQLFDR